MSDRDPLKPDSGEKKRAEIEELARMLGESPERTDDQRLRCINCYQAIPEVRNAPVYCAGCGVGPLCQSCYQTHFEETHETARPAPAASRSAGPTELPWRERRQWRKAAAGAALTVFAAGLWQFGATGGGEPTTPAIEALEVGPGAPRAAAPRLPVEIASFTSDVRQGGLAELRLLTVAGAVCSIEVRLKSGPSRARGLGEQTAGPSGAVEWRWRVAANAAPGIWPVRLECISGDGAAQTETSLTISPRE